MRKIRFIPTILIKVFIQFVYAVCCLLFKVNEQKAAFASYRSSKLAGNLLYIYHEMKIEFPNRDYQLLLNKFDSSLLGKIAYAVHLIKATYHLSTSRFFIIDDFYFPVYVIKPRQGTEIVQLWHAAGAFKKFGLSTIGTQFGPSREYLKHVHIHSNYSRVYVSSKDVVPFYAEAFGMDENKIFPLGLPRTDYFFDKRKTIETKKRFYSDYPRLKDKKVLLYAPTYRGRSHYQEPFTSPIEFSLLKKKLGQNYVVLIHLHPYMNGTNLSNDEFVYHIHDEFDIQELLLIADLLITDYSSVIFDYSLLKKPIAFFAHDLQEYIKERDFYLDFDKMVPGPIFHDTEGLAKWVKQENYDLNSIDEFQHQFFDYADGQTSKRIVHHLMNK